jgi:hypothetical protein
MLYCKCAQRIVREQQCCEATCLGYGLKDLVTGTAKPDAIWEAAQKVYEGYPELLEAARKVLGR